MGVWFWILTAGLAVATMALSIRLYFHRRAWEGLRDALAAAGAGQKMPRIEIEQPLIARLVAVGLNRQCRLFEGRLEAEVRHRVELEAVLRSMIEGVIVIDLDQRIRSLNLAAGKLLGVEAGKVLGQNVLEVVRDLPLQEFIGEVLATEVPIQDEIPLQLYDSDGRPADKDGGPSDNRSLMTRLLEVQASTLYNSDGERTGAIIVLHDVTRMRKLEAVRRDFVANVSHEIKTPVAAIKASVETILDNMDAPLDEIESFLGIITRQSDRLQAIIEDLLALARIEQDAKDARIELARAPLLRSVREAVETCQAKASEKDITIHIDCPPDLEATINAPLLEQALVNLLDNAIKFSPPHSPIEVHVVDDQPEEVVIQVTDQGPGIDQEHHERLFERFYRTDRARSRLLGGTGLGLAIVKHIMDAHGGRASVNSEPGRGSTFGLHLPYKPGGAERLFRTESGAAGNIGSHPNESATVLQTAGDVHQTAPENPEAQALT